MKNSNAQIPRVKFENSTGVSSNYPTFGDDFKQISYFLDANWVNNTTKLVGFRR